MILYTRQSHFVAHFGAVAVVLYFYLWLTNMGGGQSSKKSRTVDISAPKLKVSSSERRSGAEVTENRISRLETSHVPVDNGCEQVDSQAIGWHDDQNSHARPKSCSVPVPNTSVDHYFHKAAQAGLMSKEDFSAVVLRQTVKAPDGSALAKQKTGMNASQLPLPMLVQIKGRRNVQVRLVECAVKSLNDSDVFLLLTETELFQWIGKASNGFERAKSGELASRILRGKEMGCRTLSVITLECQSAEQQAGNMSQFMKLLGGNSNSQIAVASAAVNDEDFELHCIKSCVVYAVEEHQQKPIPLTERCGRILEHSMLSPTEVFVFDFYSEVYVWVGSHSSRQLRQQGIHQASELFRMGYLESKASTKRGSIFLSNWISGSRQSRPKWALLTRATDGAEPFLFKEKFIDWPGTSRPFTPVQAAISNISHQSVQLQPCSINEMKKRTISPPDFTVLGKNLGRGLGVPSSDYNGGHSVTTTSLTIWNIQEFSYHNVPENKHGVFYSDEGYVVRWSYSVARNTASHTRSSSVIGLGNCCYFFWLGKNCTVTEQGATAMLTVELDKEKGPQIRVPQGKELPAFLQLFGGGMIVYVEQLSSQKSNRMFYVGGEMPREAYLVDIPIPSSVALRSRGCFIVTAIDRHEVYVWFGCKATENSFSVAMTAANRLVERLSLEGNGGMELLKISEGHEDQQFWRALGGKQDYYNLLQEPKVEAFTPRLFLLSRASGKFAAEEILSPSRLSDGTCIFPFLQSDLYDAPQPALFLLDAWCCVYLWCGWWPVHAEDGKPTASTGMATDHWLKDKELGMKTATDYAKSIGEECPAYVVVAGCEPPQFTTLFPFWIETKVATNVCNQSGLRPIQEQLQTFEKKFSVEALRARPVPNGVDPVRLETYLTDKDFEAVFGMSREAFSRLPGWKQTKAKQVAGLY